MSVTYSSDEIITLGELVKLFANLIEMLKDPAKVTAFCAETSNIKEILESKNEIQKLHLEATKLDTENKKHIGKISHLSDELSSKETNLIGWQNQLANMQNQLDFDKKQYDKLMAKLAKDEAEITDLQQKLINRTKELDSKHEKADSKIAELESTIASYKQKLSKLSEV